MFLASIYVNGFKSFASKTELQFSNGITCIIGPNGCGKSNIVDAIRWVIGEQRAGALRSDKMVDVIFNGNGKRKPLGFCDVSLKIINDKGILPSEYQEVIVTRRVYRSGESEYFINNGKCRLKDIQGLFMDTGMGPDAYSVIELKMIEQILSSNANERRQLFEEAAGIKKYKIRRKSAQKKLEETEQNLLRIFDILEEIKKKTNHLAKQAEKVKIYKKLHDELRSLEILVSSYHYHQLNDKLIPLKEQLENEKFVQENNISQLSLDEAILESLKLELLEVETRLNQDRKLVFDHEDRMRVIHEQELLQKEQIKNSAQLIERLQKDIETNASHQISSDLQIERLRTDLDKTQEAKDKLEQQLTICQDEYDQASRSLLKEKEAFVTCEFRYKSIQDSINKILQEIEKLTIRETHLNERILLLNSDENSKLLIQLEKENTEIETQLNLKLKELENVQLVIKENELDSTEKITKIKTAKEQKESAERQFLQFESKRNVLEDSLLSGELYPELIRKFQELAYEFEEYLGIFSEIITIKTDAPEFLANAFKSYASLPVFRQISRESFKQIQLNFSGLTFISLPSQLGNNNLSQANYLESDLLNKNELQFISQSFVNFKDDFPSADLDKNKIYVAGDFLYSTFDGLVQTFSEHEFNLMSVRKNIDALSAELDKWDVVVSEKEKDLFELEDNYEKHLESLKQILSNSKKIEYEIQEIHKKKHECLIGIAHYRKLIDHSQADAVILVQEKQLITNKIQQLSNELQQKTESENTLEKDYKELKIMVEELQRKFNLKNEENQRVQFEFSKTEQLENSQKEQLKREYYFKKNADDEIEKKKAEIERLKKSGMDFEKISSERQDILNAMVMEKERLLGLKLNTETDYLNQKEKISKTEEQIKQIQKKREKHIETLKQLEIKSHEYEFKIQSLGERIYKEYGLDIYQSSRPEKFELMKSDKEIFRIKNEIQSLGEINALAIEEYAAEKERFDFLQKQYDDLDSSKSLLLETIETINQTAKEQFQHVFQQIRHNFQLVFQDFFERGDADLQLQEDEDVLEGQIEIQVNIKGRHLHTLAMLSGGEKTLTAISLLFAIYLYKPSPFCILDEVDAPLDDVNISRFTSALRKFSKNTQFIIITHNKRTMEAADYLFGVTQEEEGVSKLVSVKFN